MMGFDDGALSSESRLDYIRIYGSLCQKINGAYFLRLFLKYPDKFFAYYLTLVFGFGYPGKLLIETLCGIDPDEIKIKSSVFAEHFLNLIAFILSKEPVINKNACKLASYRT